MPNRVTATAKRSVAVKNACEPLILSPLDTMHRRSPRHVFMSWRQSDRGNFLRILPIARPVPCPNCPLTAVCKLTSGTRPRDARSLASLALSPRTGQKKLYHSSPLLLI
ncbi:MAG: hypothetical protein [Anelloviridae sp.]|nr:MAG: hypothetical protein [Anelloviridae sp.]